MEFGDVEGEIDILEHFIEMENGPEMFKTVP
jgi:hypothetical protein